MLWKPVKPLECVVLKNISQLGWLFPIYGKIENVPNHQPDVFSTFFNCSAKKKCCSHGFFRLQQRGSSCRSLFFLLAHLSGRKILGLVNWQKMGHRNSWFTFDSDIRYVNVYQRVSLGKFLDAISCYFPHLLFICGNGLSDTDKSRSIAKAACFGHLLDLLGLWKRWHRNKLVWKCLLSSDIIEILEDIKRISRSFQIHVYPSLSILILVGWWDIFWSFPWNPITNHAGVVLPPHLALLATSATSSAAAVEPQQQTSSAKRDRIRPRFFLCDLWYPINGGFLI